MDGRVDFYIDKTRQWAIEFLIAGNEKGKERNVTGPGVVLHYYRFTPSGAYELLPRKEELIVDFRPVKLGGGYIDIENWENETEVKPRQKFLPNTWVVLYDASNWSFVKIYQYGRQGEFLDVIKTDLLSK